MICKTVFLKIYSAMSVWFTKYPYMYWNSKYVANSEADWCWHDTALLARKWWWSELKYRTLVINDLLIDIFDLVTFISILGWVAVIGLVKMLKRNTAPFILLHGGLWRQFVSSFVGASFGRSPMARPLLLSEEDPSSFVYLPYYGVQNIILGTKTLFSGQEHSFGGKNIILGT